MSEIDFDSAFCALTGNAPFPWQRELYRCFMEAEFPSSCNLPTGLGKTAVIPIWLLALASAPAGRIPRRLVYVVNRRTVVDQSTREAEKLRERLPSVPAVFEALRQKCSTEAGGLNWSPLAISTLRGQFADNREWSADPARPAVVVGTVDMIGSRLLFSGYGVGFKAKPLHAGFLGQDALLVHDEAHLEPAFQKLLIAIREEQERCKEFGTFRVMELSATSRNEAGVFELTEAEKNPPDTIPDPPEEPIHHVWRRQKAKKAVHLHENKDEKQLAEEIAGFALKHKDSGRAVLVFVRKVEDVEKIVGKLNKEKQQVQQLTGTLRGLERDRMADPRREKACPIFARFLKRPKPDAAESEQWKIEPQPGTVYLVCTSAGEVGVNISGDHLVCDLTTFDSMAQRFGRVNRFGDRDDTRIDIVYPNEFDEKDDYDSQRKKTLKLLWLLNGDGSPKSLGELDADVRRDAFAPEPIILSTSDILFDAWALTTIPGGKLPGRPLVEPFLRGIGGSELPETHVAWREEVDVITESLLTHYKPADLLEDYPLKPHELLRDNSSRIFDRLKRLAAPSTTLVWVIADDNSVKVSTLAELIQAGKDDLSYKTVLLPPLVGGLKNGLLTSDSESADDVADEWRDEQKAHRRYRQVWDEDSAPAGMRFVRMIDTKLDADEDVDDESTARRYWRWYEIPKGGDSDGSKTDKKPVSWQVHTCDVVKNAERFVAHLMLSGELQKAVILAAKFHDLGKRRELWQRSIGHKLPKNPQSDDWLAKSGGKMKLPNFKTDYRHEFGSLLDVLEEADFKALKDKPELQDLILHLIAVHHGYGRPHFPENTVFDPEPKGQNVAEIAAKVPQRYVRLQRKFGRWGLAYLESLLRAADYAASAKPSAFVEVKS